MMAFLVVGVSLGLASRTAAAEGDVEAVLAKAIEAYGGKEKLEKYKATQTKAKGTIDLPGVGSVAFAQESSSQMTGQLKEVMEMEINGQKVNVTTGFDGKAAWMNFNGMVMEPPEPVLAELKEVSYSMKVGRLTALTDKKQFELSLLGEVMVNNRPAVGIKVSSKGHKDINLYFDKEKGLLAKIERRKKDMNSGQEVTEERLITEYMDVDGLKTAKKLVVNVDGKKFIEAEVTEVKHLDKLDDSEFAKP
jgi:hypothetical protein